MGNHLSPLRQEIPTVLTAWNLSRLYSTSNHPKPNEQEGNYSPGIFITNSPFFFMGNSLENVLPFSLIEVLIEKPASLKKRWFVNTGNPFIKVHVVSWFHYRFFLPSSVLIFARRVSCPICNRISLPDSLHCWEQSLVKKLFVFLWTFLYRSIHRASHNLPLILIWSINKAYFYPVMEVARKRWDEYGITTSAPVTLPQNNGYYRWVVYIVNDKR